MMVGSHLAAAWGESRATPHIFGLLPGRQAQAMQAKIESEPEHTHEQTSNGR
jgi:xanthosine utilization system XapX-like protein